MKKTNGTKLDKINRITGKHRKWVCCNHSAIDSLLEQVEALYHYGENDLTPPDVCLKMADSLESRARGLRGSAERRSNMVLTESEAHYCELEGIAPEDFLKRKYDSLRKS